MTDVRDSDGKVVGYTTNYKGNTGPVIYGDVPIIVAKDSPADLRIFAAISSRESPLRATPTKPVFQAVGALNGCQAYEAHGISAGAVHWISKNGNFQRLLFALANDLPMVAEEIATRYSFSDEGSRMFFFGGEELTTEDYRSTEFCVWAYELLGLHFMFEDHDADDVEAARKRASEVQCAQAWKLINDRDHILDSLGWLDAVTADERLRLITASMAVNVGVDTFQRMLMHANEKTAKSLTDSRVREYNRMGAGFGVTRSNWELSKCDLVVDGRPFKKGE